MIKLSPQQEKFAQEIFKTKNQSDAYRAAYPCKNMADKTINEAASRLVANSKVMARLEELRKPIIEKFNMTAEDLIRDLEKAKTMAMETEQISPYINAVMGQAKLLGLDKQVIEGAVTVVTMAMVKKDGKPLKYNIGKEIKK